MSAVEASRDAKEWVTIRDNIRLQNWGASWEVDELLPATLLGTDSLWLRIRLLTEAAEPERGYTVAQFARSVTGRSDPIFVVEATCAPVQ